MNAVQPALQIKYKHASKHGKAPDLQKNICSTGHIDCEGFYLNIADQITAWAAFASGIGQIG